MMKFVLCVAIAVVAVEGQVRPFYAPRPFVYPQVIVRGEDQELANRVGGNEEAVVSGSVMMVGGSVHDQELHDRVAALPADKQPFWYVNQQHIQQHINRNQQQGLPNQQFQSSFQSRG